MKKFLCIWMSIFFILSGFSVYAEADKTVTTGESLPDPDLPLIETAGSAVIGQTLEIGAKSVILMEVKTGQILYESNADEKTAPASITKIMSLLLVMEAIDKGTIDLETVVSASEHASSMGGSQIWLEPGESMTVDDLLKAAVIGSANDATVALGEKIAGSEEGFVALMNERAQELGMDSTHFVNCTGLDADGHETTAHDVAIMACELIQHSLIKNYTTVWMDSLRDGKSELVNTNKLVRFYEGTTGLKTGTTSKAGYCLAATAERDGLELAAVVMDAESSNERFNGAKKLLDFGFANYSFVKLDAGLEEQPSAPVVSGVVKEVPLEYSGTLELLLPKNTSDEITRKTVIYSDTSAPVKAGDRMGEVEIYVGEEKAGEIPLTAAQDVKKRTFAVTFGWLIAGMLSL